MNWQVFWEVMRGVLIFLAWLAPLVAFGAWTLEWRKYGFVAYLLFIILWLGFALALIAGVYAT